MKKDEELTPEEYKIIREKGTEAPFTGKYLDSKEKGMFVCKVCGAELFSSDAKFDSGTGWPSFDLPAGRQAIQLKPDDSYGMHRTEVTCAKCGAHLGHLFDDGPAERGGKRYCINSICLDHKPEESK
jgi:peptide-methionine (R)-S-oxide reductase